MRSLPPTALLFLLSLLLPAFAAPTQSHCRCFIVDSRKPWAPSTPALRESQTLHHHQPDTCAPLGQELEHWRTADPDIYQTFLESIIRQRPRETPTEDDLRPLPTSVLMEIARNYERYHESGADRTISNAPTPVPPHERIICRTVVEEEGEYQDSATTLFVLSVIVVMAVLACAAECLVLLLNCLNRRREPKNRVRLSGEEKKLLAYSNSSRPNSPLSEKSPDQLFVCTAYHTDFSSDEESTAVL